MMFFFFTSSCWDYPNVAGDLLRCHRILIVVYTWYMYDKWFWCFFLPCLRKIIPMWLWFTTVSASGRRGVLVLMGCVSRAERRCHVIRSWRCVGSLFSCCVRMPPLRSELNGKNDQLQQMAQKLEEYKENMLKVTPPPLRPLPPGPCLPARAAGVVLDFLARSRGRAVPSRSFASCKRVLDNIRERRGLVF